MSQENQENTENIENSEAQVPAENPSPETAPSEASAPTQRNERGERGRGGPRGGRRNDRGGRRNDRQPKEFQEELLAIDRVTRVTTGWRQLRFRAVIVLGDGKGRVGIGTGKSWEVVDAIAKAVNNAKKNIVKVKMENGSIPYNVETKYKSAKIMLHPASEGTGIIAGGAMRKVLSVAGYKDILGKRYGSSNLINNARATIQALTSFKS